MITAKSISKTTIGSMTLFVLLTISLPCDAQGQTAQPQKVLKGEIDRNGCGTDDPHRPVSTSAPLSNGNPGTSGGPGSNGNRPDWIPPDAYTNSDMVINSYFRVNGGGRVPVRISEGKLNLEPSIARFWNQTQNYPACQVSIRPMWQHPGAFMFNSDNSGGPRGWVQDIGTSPDGFPSYRFWYSHSSTGVERSYESVARLGPGSYRYPTFTSRR